MASTKAAATGTTAPTRALDLLCLLDSYDIAHSSGRDSQRTGQWKIGTARREKGGFHLHSSSATISALNVREELRAKAVLTVSGNDDAPGLIDEDATAKKALEGEQKDLFTLHPDGIPRDNTDNDNAAADAVSKDEKGGNTSSSGLRQRKNAPRKAADGKKEKSEWSEEIPPAVLTEEEQEEEKLRLANPLDLFGGLPPPSLRAAQVKAREALASYVEAANIAAEIIRITNEAEKDKA